jgi:hypothetical protein
MATLDNDDLKALKDLMAVTIDEAIEEKLVTKDHIDLLSTKDEFFTKMDEVMGELKAIREEQPLQSHKLSEHEDRIEKIEDHLGHIFKLAAHFFETALLPFYRHIQIALDGRA